MVINCNFDGIPVAVTTFKLESSKTTFSTSLGGGGSAATEAGGETSTDVTRRFTRTIVTRSNYDTTGGDTNIDLGPGITADTSYFDRGEGLSADVLIASSDVRQTSTISTSAQLDRTADDLSSFKRRIDANTEEQREHADVMASLQRKVEEYRRRIADIESQIASHRTDDRVTFNITEVGGETWAPEVKDMGAEYELASRLDDERRKNEELRLMISQLQTEIQRLQQQYDANLKDKERGYQIRERNLAQYLSEEQKKIMDLWTELQQVRRQCSDIKLQTERDLEVQRQEFLNAMRNVGGVARNLNLSVLEERRTEGGGVVSQDTVLMEALRRFRDQQQGEPSGASLDDYNALMKRYEEAIERIVELESRGEGGSSKLAALEAELKRTRERLAESQEVLRKLHNLAKESTHGEVMKRARSLSPSGHVIPTEVLRSVRYAIRTRDNELQQLQRKLKNAEMQVNEMVSRFESTEEARKRLEKQLADSKREISIQTKAVEDATREVRRLEERLRASETEKGVAESARRKLEEEIRRLRVIIDQTDIDGVKKALEDAEAQNRIQDEEYKNRIMELLCRIDSLADDNKRLKGDLSTVKDKNRQLEVEYQTVVRKLDEKELAMKNLDDIRRELAKDLENQRARFDALTSEFDHLQTNFDSTHKNTVSIEMTIKEVKQQRDEIGRQRDDLARQLADITHKFELEIKRREDIEKASLRHLSEIEKLKAELADYEKQVMMLRRHNDELDTQLKTSQAKITTLENSLTSAQKEIAKLSELNGKLQAEKNDIMSSKQKVEVELDQSKERVRRLEIDIEKLLAENKTLHENEDKARLALKDEIEKVRRLERELQDAKHEIDELKRRLNLLDQENKQRLESALQTRRSDTDRSSTYESTQVTEVRVKELGDKHRIDLERLQNDRDDLARRLQLLQDELAEKQRIIDRQSAEINELKRQYQTEIDRLKAELVNLENKYQNELEDERDQHQREIEALRAEQDDLRSKIQVLEKRLEEVLAREKLLQKEVVDWEEKYNDLNKELQRVRDELEMVRLDAEKEIQRWKTEAYTAQTEIKNLESSIDSLKGQLASANERNSSLNKTINEQAARIREMTSHVRRLEEELAETKATLATTESDLENALARLNTVEQQYATAQLENNKLRSEIDSLNRQIDVLKNTNASYEAEIERLKKKVVHLTDTAKQQAVELEKLRNERDQLDKAYREKAKLVDQLNETVKTLETKVNRMRQELHDLSEKLVAVETERNTLRAEIKKLEQELQFGRDQMMRKTDEFHAALDDLANAHRIAEDGRVNALQELETRKFEIADLQSRLENAEKRLMSLQQEYVKVDQERDQLSEALRRFQTTISRTSVTGPVDLQSVDVYVQKLMSRIDMLERERNDYRDSLGRLERKTSEHVTVNKHETLYRSIEERLADAEDERHKAEVKLTSAKELIRSQEEALKQRDDERRQMKSKITTFELETRGKEAQIRHLNELVKKLQADLDSCQTDVRTYRERVEEWDLKRAHQLGAKIPDEESETKIKLLITSFETERQNLNDTLRKLTTQLQASESKNADLKDDVDRLKRELAKAERVEIELRRNLEEQTRIARECQHLQDQLSMARSDAASANNRKQQLESELMSVRTELRDFKQRLHDATGRVSDLERQLQDANMNKNRLSDRVAELDRTIASMRSTESDLRQQLATANSERKALQQELDELKKRIAQFEADKRRSNEKVDELKRIRITLIKRIEILETEKRSAETVINETAAQREAIERSLSALERENKELCRNCAQLQQQIAQLELDNGNRLIAITNKQREEHDRFVQSVKSEKAQVERIIENRDRSQKNRIKQLETQLSILREQLNQERLRRRDATDRVYLSEMSKVGSTVFGLSSSGIASAGPAISYPQTDSFDYLLGSGGHQSSSLTSGYYAIPSSDVYKTTSTSLALREPVETSHQSYATSYHKSGISGVVTESAVSGAGQLAAETSSSTSRYDQPYEQIGDSEIKKRTTIIVQTRSARTEE